MSFVPKYGATRAAELAPMHAMLQASEGRRSIARIHVGSASVPVMVLPARWMREPAPELIANFGLGGLHAVLHRGLPGARRADSMIERLRSGP